MSSSEFTLPSKMARSIVASVNWGLPAEKQTWSSYAHDRGAKQGEAEPTLEPVDCLTVWLVMLDGNHWS